MTADINTRLGPTQDRLPLEREARARTNKDRMSDAHPLSHYRDVRAWVLLADPGAGKSDVLTSLALNESGTCISARDFVDLDLPAVWHEPLFIDALDEITSGQAMGSTPLSQIRQKLQQLGTPKFRLSCREADWRGNADGDALKRLVGEDCFAELRLTPLTHAQSVALIAHWQPCTVPLAEAFMQEAERRDLDGLLDNPQTLRMLVKAHAANGGDWPASKTHTYELACVQLVHEHNDEHLASSRDSIPPDDQTLLAAGYLCAVMLLSGSGSIALQRHSQPHVGVVTLPELKSTAPAPDLSTCRVALHTRLFRGTGRSGEFAPVHRTVAEYLAAHYLASRIHAGLPASRVLALMLGEDSGLVPELRGLHAWLAAVAPAELRRELIAHDPLGVVLNGDVRAFSRTDKLTVLDALRHEASQDASFRRGNWTSHPFGSLATADMEDDFKALLLSPERSPAHQALLGCVLDALEHGQPMPALTTVLERVVRDKSYWPSLRTAALDALVIYAQALATPSMLTQLLEDVHANVVEDPEDELLGRLLQTLYPDPISPARVFRYFHEPKANHLIGSYQMFWHESPKNAVSQNEVSTLLDSLVGAGYQLTNEHDRLGSADIVGELLVYGVHQHGTQMEVERLYNWLSLGLGPHAHCPLSAEFKSALKAWLSDQPACFKVLFEHGLQLQTVEDDNAHRHLWRVRARLYGATEPDDAATWYLSLAKASSKDTLRQQLVTEAFQLTQQREGADAAIQLLERWAANHPIDMAWVQDFLCCPYPPEASDQAYIDSEIKRKIEKCEQNRQRINFFHKTLPSFEHGPAHLGALAEVANAYLNFFRQSRQETPVARLLEVLNQNKALVHLALHGLRQCLFRDDLPSVADILKLHATSRRYNLASPCLAAMELRYAEDAATAFDLPPSTLETVTAFRLTNHFYEVPEWFKQLLAQRPEVLVKVMPPLISQQIAAKSEHIEGLYGLARDPDYATVAQQIVPQLIANFPIKASQKQLKGLRLLVVAVLTHLDQPTQLTLIAKKLNTKGMDVAQQAYWLTAGTLLEPELYIERMRQFSNKTQARTSHVFAMVHELRAFSSTAKLPITTQSLLVGLLGPRCSRKATHSGAYTVTPEMEMGDYVAGLISNLSNNPDDAATHALTELQQRPDMKQWHDSLNRALYDQRIARRKVLFKPATVKQVCDTLANLKPASAADLWALTVDQLKRLISEIRNGNTNDYRQYWEGDRPRIEDDCRDALLSDLKPPLSRLGILAEPEGRYADEKRADIKVMFASHHIPVEIKREMHKDLWKAIGGQLVAKYGRETSSDGYGIFIVFWFTGQSMPVPGDGGVRPKTPQELQQRLTATVPEALKHKIAVLVVDCSKPQAT